jgi:NodT family efflux transporter outer membrane factor (OMF) lipoprotein
MAEADDVRLSIATETAQAYVGLRHAQQRFALARQSEDIQNRLLRIVSDRERLGVASRLELERAAALRDTTRAEIPSIDADMRIAMDRLAVLTGTEPGTLDAMLADVRAIPPVPEQIAVGDPATLLRRRPDIRAAERRLAGATALIGVATADLFPKLSLTGFLGLRSGSIGGLDSGFTYGVGPSLRWLFPDFGGVRARIEAATGRRDELLAVYQGTVLNALRDAEGAVVRFARAGDEQILRESAEASAVRAANLAQARYRAGAGSLIETLDAERDRVAASFSRADAAARRIGAFVTLQKSLGLAWEQRQGSR